MNLILILDFPFRSSLSSDGDDVAAGLGQDVNTPATSYVTLVFDDGHSRAHKVNRDFPNAWT